MLWPKTMVIGCFPARKVIDSIPPSTEQCHSQLMRPRDRGHFEQIETVEPFYQLNAFLGRSEATKNIRPCWKVVKVVSKLRGVLNFGAHKILAEFQARGSHHRSFGA